MNTAIITHSDNDHVNGLAAFPAGLTIIAQENCKKEMEASAGSRNPAPQDRLPTKTYNKKDNLTIDGVRLHLYHWAAGHTSGDTVVYLTRKLFSAATWWSPIVPIRGFTWKRTAPQPAGLKMPRA